MALSSDIPHATDFPSNGELDALDSLAIKVWTSAAPKPVRRADRLGDHERAWWAWTRHLAKRRKPKPLHKLLGSRSNPLLWGVGLRDDCSAATLIDQLDGLRKQKNAEAPDVARWTETTTAWLDAASGGEPRHLSLSAATDPADPSQGLESLAWCHALPSLAATLPPALWWRLVEHLIATAEDAQQLQVQIQPLATQLLGGELPLTLAYVLPELLPTRDLDRVGRRSLSYGLAEILDADGLPSSACMAEFPLLLACWTRSRAMQQAVDRGIEDKECRRQFRSTVATALRLARRDGSLALAAPSDSKQTGRANRELLDAAVRVADHRTVDRLAQRVLPVRRGAKDSGSKRLPKVAVHSDTAQLALMRTTWQCSAARMNIGWHEQQVSTELAVGGDTLLAGAWDLRVRVGGVAAELTSDWEEICWVSDSDMDYLELAADLSTGGKVERSLLLVRNGNFLFLADAILGTKPATIEYASTLPLAGGVQYAPEEEHYEGRLSAGRTRGTVVPLALPEWRSERGRGALVENERGLELRQSDHGTRLFAPVFIDLDPKRRRHELTWRQLTVADQRQIQPRDVAVGYRVQIGNQQWLVYRSLAERASRSVLGQNLSTDFLVARFRRSGKVETLLEIE